MKKIVVKIGSSVIAPRGRLDEKLISKIVKDILLVEKKGYKVVLVSSGAIACGLERLGYKKKPQEIFALTAISSLGQILLMDVFNAKFKKHKRMCAQILLTWDDFDNRKRFMNVRKTIDKLFAMNIIPIGRRISIRIAKSIWSIWSCWPNLGWQRVPPWMPTMTDQ